MALVSRVGEIPHRGASWAPIELKGKTSPGNVALSCHFATVYWLFHEAYGSPITLDEYAELRNPQFVIDALMPYGTAVQQSHRTQAAAGIKVKATGALVKAGSIIVFGKTRTHADHSCVAVTSTEIHGYNQANWFSTPGGQETFSNHCTKDIIWKTKHLARRDSTNTEGYLLIAIDETTAVDFIKQKNLRPKS